MLSLSSHVSLSQRPSDQNLSRLFGSHTFRRLTFFLDMFSEKGQNRSWLVYVDIWLDSTTCDSKTQGSSELCKPPYRNKQKQHHGWLQESDKEAEAVPRARKWQGSRGSAKSVLQTVSVFRDTLYPLKPLSIFLQQTKKTPRILPAHNNNKQKWTKRQ